MDNVEPVYPTPTIGMLGLIKDKNNIMTLAFKEKGDMIFFNWSIIKIIFTI